MPNPSRRDVVTGESVHARAVGALVHDVQSRVAPAASLSAAVRRVVRDGDGRAHGANHFGATLASIAAMTALQVSPGTLAATGEEAISDSPNYGFDFELIGVQENDYSGHSVSGAGDFNGDGLDDLIIGAFLADEHNRENVGESYVVFGVPPLYRGAFWLGNLIPDFGGDGTNGVVLTGIDERDLSGRSVSDVGDINGDGIDDVIIGAYGADPIGHCPRSLFPCPRTYAGETYVVFGKPAFEAVFELRSLFPRAGGDGSAGFVLTGIHAYDFSSSSVSGAGDLNGDGIDDLIIGAAGASPNGQLKAGESYVVLGRTTGFPAKFALSSLLPENGGDGSTGFVLEGIDTYDFSGLAVSGTGDINDDGIDDVIIGAPFADPDGISLTGESYVVFGRNTGFPPVFALSSLAAGDGSEGFSLEGVDAADYSGWSVSGARDINGDGIDDLIIGAPYADPDGTVDVGESYVVFGRNTGFSPVFELSSLAGGNGNEGFVLEGDGIEPHGLSGRSVSDAGDINADGIDDVIIGAPYSLGGTAYVVFGRNTGFPALFELSSLGSGDGSEGCRVFGGVHLGSAVSAAGDVNGDGIDDLIVSDPSSGINYYGNYIYDIGVSYVLFGRTTGFEPNCIYGP